MPEIDLAAPPAERVEEQPATAAPVVIPPPKTTKPSRLVSLDAYRGFIMLAMASGGLGLAEIARKDAYRDSALWKFLAYQTDHVEWTGCGFWDLIQPSFMFMVGVAIPYSYAARKAKGDADRQIWFHTFLRALLLVALGVFLASSSSRFTQTNFLFTNVLAQIGLGYCFVYLLRGLGWRIQLGAVAAICIGYWLVFYLYTPPENLNLATVGIKPEWRDQHWMSGLFAHWNKNVNAAWAFDVRFLNWFPREKPFEFEGGGYQTLNFVPSMATMILGLMAGELLRSERSGQQKFLYLCAAGLVCLALGFVLDLTVCPSVKRIWTPSWAIFSSGWTFLMLAGFYGVIDLLGYQRWAFALVIVGMNSIAVYMMAQLLKGWTWDTLRKHFGPNLFKGTYSTAPLLKGWASETLCKNFGQNLFKGSYTAETLFPADFEPLARSVAFLLVLWLVSLWMYRQKIFVRI